MLDLLLRIIKFFIRPVKFYPNSIGKVLVYDCNFMGDMITSSPVYRALRTQLLNYVSIHALAYDVSIPVLHQNPCIDTVYIQRKGLWGQIVQALTMRWSSEHSYDLIIHLNTSLKTNFLIWLMGAKYRVGYDYKDRACFCNIRVPSKYRTARTINRIDENCELLEKAFGWKITNRNPVFVIKENVISRVESFLARDMNITETDFVVVVHPSCRQDWEKRRWSPRRFRTVVEFLITLYNAKIIFTGHGKEDDKYVNAIRSQIPYPTESLVGYLDVEELGALLKRANLVVTVNTFTMHLAGALKRPTVAIIGGTPAKVVAYNNEDFVYLEDPALKNWNPENLEYKPNMGDIFSNEVSEKIEWLVANKRINPYVYSTQPKAI